MKFELTVRHVIRTEEPFRLLAVSDTHGFVDPRVAALATTCDAVVHAGDIGTGAVLKALKPPGGRVYAVRGNNDTPGKWRSAEHTALGRLPSELVLELTGGQHLVVVHGDRVQPATTRVQQLRERYPRARIVIHGHTHRVLDDRSATPWILNPGAAGATRTYGGASCMMLVVSRGRWRLSLKRFPSVSTHR